MSIKAALRSVVLAIIAITGVSAYGFVVAFKWLYKLEMEKQTIVNKSAGDPVPVWRHPKSKKWHGPKGVTDTYSEQLPDLGELLYG